MKNLLVVMAKQPIPERTKTRLHPPLSFVQAAALYECMLRDKTAMMRQVPDTTPAIAYSPANAKAYFHELAPDFVLYKQIGDTLDQRLLNVTRQGFADGYDQVMAIDGDSVTLPPAYLMQGFTVLSEHADVDVVLGPSDDGGYYGIGLKAVHPCVFDVEMSTPTVSEDTIRQAEANGLRVYLLPEWYDVDTPDDLKRVSAELKANPAIAPHTAAYLKGLH